LNIKMIKIWSIFALSLTICLVSVFILPGCSTSQQPVQEETPVQEEEAEEETQETAEEQGEAVEVEEAEEEAGGSIADLEIKGNINILNGFELSDTVSDDRPVAVMVENSPPARPQSGLINADIVFEVVDEYNITRYIAVFSSKEADIIGAVRSARIYYAEIARSLDPIYVFWGTYDDAYPVLKKMDMDALDANSDVHFPYTNAGWRDYSRSDISWSTAFINTQGIKEDAIESGYSLEGGQSPMRFKIDAVESERGSITDININISIAEYIIDFKYNKDKNNYSKFTAGTPHIDFDSGEQINVNNIIVLVTNIDGPIDQYGHMVVRTIGTHEIGEAYYFLDGNVIEGTWGRSSIFDPFEFRDLDGNPVLFNRGSTWVCMIPDSTRLSY